MKTEYGSGAKKPIIAPSMKIYDIIPLKNGRRIISYEK